MWSNQNGSSFRTNIRVRFKLLDRAFHVVRHRKRYHSRAGEAFMEIAAKRGTR
jgi:hypothetical protein